MKAPHASIAWSDLRAVTLRPDFVPGRKFNGQLAHAHCLGQRERPREAMSIRRSLAARNRSGPSSLLPDPG